MYGYTALTKDGIYFSKKRMAKEELGVTKLDKNLLQIRPVKCTH